MAAGLLMLLAACATRPPAPGADPWRVFAPLLLNGVSVDTEWLLPPAPVAGLVLLEHGFGRSCANLRGTASRLMQQGLMVLCLDADMAGGRPALARALAAAIAGGLRAPDGRALSQAVVVGGHSAGAVFAAYTGAALAVRAPDRLAGALLLDPVATPGLAAALQAIAGDGRRPVLAVLAEPGRCNLHNNALPALRALPQAFIGLRLPGATHLDVEGADTTALAVAACGQGAPQAANVAALRRIAAAWALDLAQGRPPQPEAGGLPLR
ncbi:MAG: alpha/beta hydrolase [Burkholderiales bacterium]|nr:alpha/beta hydrolase [Burkholderiales bacterium]